MAQKVTSAHPLSGKQQRVSTRQTTQKKRGALAVFGSLSAHVVMIITVAICLFPLVVVISTSFKLPNDVFDLKIIPSHPTLSNYQYALC